MSCWPSISNRDHQGGGNPKEAQRSFYTVTSPVPRNEPDTQFLGILVEIYSLGQCFSHMSGPGHAWRSNESHEEASFHKDTQAKLVRPPRQTQTMMSKKNCCCGIQTILIIRNTKTYNSKSVQKLDKVGSISWTPAIFLSCFPVFGAFSFPCSVWSSWSCQSCDFTFPAVGRHSHDWPRLRIMMNLGGPKLGQLE